MKVNVAAELKALERMTAGELREKYLQVFGEESRSGNRDFLRKRLAWRIQALAEGGLSERALRRAEELANDADLRIRAPKGGAPLSIDVAGGPTAIGRIAVSQDRRLPMPGTVLVRRYRDEMVTVTVLDNGFEFEGRILKSLTAVVEAITGGSHQSGHRFFGLRRQGAKS